MSSPRIVSEPGAVSEDSTIRSAAQRTLNHGLIANPNALVASSSSPLAVPPRRSNPIAIARNTSHREQADSSDEDDELLAAAATTTTTTTTVGDGDHAHPPLRRRETSSSSPPLNAQSLPSRLLRAPFLGSVPSNDDFISYHNNMLLPPPMALSESYNNVSHNSSNRTLTTTTQQQMMMMMQPSTYSERTSYGSLRESHLRGTFLDGPASYRDKMTGGIIQSRLQHRGVRLQTAGASSATTTSSSSPTVMLEPLSIGERLMKQKQQNTSNNQNQNNNNTETSQSHKKQGSLLGDILLASPKQQEVEPSHALHQLHQPSEFTLQPQSFYEPTDYIDRQTSNMLSTSLTALEVLQSGIVPGKHQRVQGQLPNNNISNDNNDNTRISSPPWANAMGEEPEDLPRDIMGQNTLIFRSSSDPTQYSTKSSFSVPQQHHATTSSIQAQAQPQTTLSLSSVGVLAMNDRQQQHQRMPTFSLPVAASSSTVHFEEHMSVMAQRPLPLSSHQEDVYRGDDDDDDKMEDSHSAATEFSPDLEGAFDMDMEM